MTYRIYITKTLNKGEETGENVIYRTRDVQTMSRWNE